MRCDCQLPDKICQHSPNLAPTSPNLSQLAPTWIQLGPNMGQLGTNMAHLGSNLAELAPNLGQLGANLAPKFAPRCLPEGGKRGRNGSKKVAFFMIGPKRAQETNLGPILEDCGTNFGGFWAPDGRQVGPKLAPISTKHRSKNDAEKRSENCFQKCHAGRRGATRKWGGGSLKSIHPKAPGEPNWALDTPLGH